MRYVFVSHANSDKRNIKPLIEALLDAGVPLWIDRPEEIELGERHLSCGRILAGRDWQNEINRALENCSCVLFVLSPHSNSFQRSDVLVREFEYGRDNDLLVIAQIAEIDHKELNPFFRVRQSIDLRGEAINDDPATLNPNKFQVLVAQLQQYLLTDARPLKALSASTGQKVSPSGFLTRLDPAAAIGTHAQKPHRPPRLMPYLANRQDQQKRFAEEVQRHFDSRAKKPLFFIICGSEPQCVDSFVEQLYCVKLREILDANGLASDIMHHTLHWPDVTAVLGTSDQQGLSDHFRDLEDQVRAVFGLKITADRALVARKVRNLGSACFFNASLSLGDWNSDHVRIVQQWIEFWASIELKEIAYPVITVIGIVYTPGYLRRVLNGQKLWKLQRDVELLKQAKADDGVIVQLPELGDVRYEDVAQWIISYVHDYDREVVRREIRKRFTGRFRIGQRRLSMYETAAVVKAVLSDPRAQTVTT